MNKCSKAREVMGAYIYGELPPNEMKKVRAHLDACPACHEEMRSQAIAVRQIPTESPELAGFEKERIFWSVQGAIRQPERGRSMGVFLKALYGLGATGAVASLLVVGIAVGTHRLPQREQADVPPEAAPVQQSQPVQRPVVVNETPAPPPAPVAVPQIAAPAPTPPIAPGAGGVSRAAEPLPDRQGKQNKKRIQSKPQILQENGQEVQQNHVETGSDSQAEPDSSRDAKPEVDIPSATTAPAPAGMDDVRETPPSEGETSSR